MEDPGIERLREHLRRHNWKVYLISGLALSVAVALWALFYFVAWWLYLLFSSAVRPIDFRPSPRRLMVAFAWFAAALCIAAWIARRLRPNQAPSDSKNFAEHFLDVLLAVPRITLFVFGTGAARARLSEHELLQAWDLLRRMAAAAEPLPVHELPLYIPTEAGRQKILLTLQLAQLIETRRTRSGPVLAFQNEAARLLSQDRVRLLP